MSSVDLNLLRVFDAIFELRSVTRTAERLSLTQSAISHALGRLRLAFDDPLFLRHPSGLQPTARATEIAPGIREGLAQLQEALAPSPFDPANARRHFRISAGGYFCALLVPELIARTRRLAPGVVLEIDSPAPGLLAALDDGRTDLAFGVFGKIPGRLRQHRLFFEDVVWIAACDNPLRDRPEALADLPAHCRLQVVVGQPFPGHGGFSWDGGLERLVVTGGEEGIWGLRDGSPRLHDAVTAIATVAVTDLVAQVPRRLAERSAREQRIAIIDTSASPDRVEMAMLWHSRLAADEGLSWLRNVALACLGEE
ncbi:MAG: LysR family transcriptional regulator [Candidatus Andeanibacterium colombiense]|uniref:LysR family transcriptional regulator n=1 Tax=Candidatus Andeanibacterium colombiense TaxID=3121345 RepID=A0AAJ5X5Z1_9SPHN|nr:MAG: LysR family transcriptional regulator [Sphingomonadaceae bacterium]